MHIYAPERDINIPGLIQITAGTDNWTLMEGVNMAELYPKGEGEVKSLHMHEHFNQDWSKAKNVCIIRPGGFGDHLFLTPTLNKILWMYPQIEKLHIACFERFQGIFDYGWPNKVGYMNYPCKLTDLQECYDTVFSMENVLEQEHDLHAVDAMAKRLNIPWSEDDAKGIHYHVSDEEQAWAQVTYPRTTKWRVGVQVEASSLARSYPIPHLFQVFAELCDWANVKDKPGIELFLFGDPHAPLMRAMRRIQNAFALLKRGADGQAEVAMHVQDKGSITNLAVEPQPPSFRQSMAILQGCDVVLAPDSVLTHVSGALGKPTVALYGPFPANLRTSYAPSIRALQGRAPCAPCFHHQRYQQPWPAHGPCAKSGRCTAMVDIEPRTIVSHIKRNLP